MISASPRVSKPDRPRRFQCDRPGPPEPVGRIPEQWLRELFLRPTVRLPAAVGVAFVLALAGCAPVNRPDCAAGEGRSVSELLYFGTAKPDGVLTAEEWSEFLQTSVTPRFPRGFTVWTASGQWRGADGVVVREGSFVLNLIHPNDEHSERAIRTIASEYKARFGQEAVLRVKNHVCTSF